jgi:hypothetical protein
MSDQLSFFHVQMLDYLQRDVEKKQIEEGFDPLYDRTFRDFQEMLKAASKSEIPKTSFSLSAIIDQYHFLMGSRGAIHLELKLLESFPKKEFEELDLFPYYPRIYRGLPRLYSKNTPSVSRVKSQFSHLPSLKKRAIEKALYSLYKEQIPTSGQVVLFTWVVSDGFGDWAASREMRRILQEAFPQVEIKHIALIPEVFASYVSKEDTIIFYKEEASLSLFQKEHWDLLQKADVVVQSPTFYPFTQGLMAQVHSVNQSVKFEHLGEYGYGDSSWFHPKSGNHSMGLHFLEAGILTRKISSRGFSELKNLQMIHWLFGMENPGPAEIESYQNSHHFYLAYLRTKEGTKIYLHALCKWLERDEKPIDLCVPYLGCLIEYFEECKKNSHSYLQADFGIKQIEVWHKDQIYREKIAETGKILRVFCPDLMSQEDFQALLIASGEFVAVRGNQSFTEAICANKAFFYDGTAHVRYFVKDLAAVAESRIATHRGTLACIRHMTRGSLAQLPSDEADWVEDTYFQQEEPFDWFEASQQMGMVLQDPDTLAGFKKFNRLLAEEFSCNQFLIHLIQRAFVHAQKPVIAYLEEKQLSLFASQRQTLKQFIQTMRTNLQET